MASPIRLFAGDSTTESASGYSFLDFIAEIDNYRSATYYRSWAGAGTCSIEMNLNDNIETQLPLYSGEFIRGRIVQFDNDENKVFIITETKKSFSQNGKGSETLTIKGRELKSILSRRIVIPPTGYAYYTDSDSAEGVLKELVKSQCGSTASANRQFSNFTIATDTDSGDAISISARYSNLFNECESISEATGLGYWIRIDRDTGTMILETSTGTDRTATSGTTYAIFSRDYDTLASASLTDSEIAYKSFAYVAGQGEGADREIVETYIDTYEPSGLQRRETFIDARDLMLTASLTTRGEQELTSAGTELFVDGSALTYSQLVLGTDYDLGDLVTVSAFGVSHDVRIVGVRETRSNGRYSIDLTFSDEV